MKKLLLLLMATLAILSCKRDDLDHSCETFFATPAEIVITDRYTENGWQDYEIDTICAAPSGLTPTFLTRRKYDEVRWLVNYDSNYTRNTPTFSLGFKPGIYTVKCIGTKRFHNNTCNKPDVHIDTISRKFISIKGFLYAHGNFNGFSSEYNKDIGFSYLSYSPDGSSSFAWLNFPRQDNLPKMSGTPAFSIGSVASSDSSEMTMYNTDTTVICKFNYYYNTKTYKININYYYDTTTRPNWVQKYSRSKTFNFTGYKIKL